MPAPSILSLNVSARLPNWPIFPETEISSGARDSRGQILFDDKSAGLTVGIWESEANLGRWMRWPVHEFMIVVSGEIVLIEETAETVVKAGETFFIPKGRRCIWNQATYARKIMLLFEDRDAPDSDGDCPIFKTDTQAPLSPFSPPGAERPDSGAPDQLATTLYQSASGRIELGLWHSTAWTRKRTEFPHHELMHILSGSVTLTEASGTVRQFSAGDTFFVPKGTQNAWHSTEPVHKIYCSITS